MVNIATIAKGATATSTLDIGLEFMYSLDNTLNDGGAYNHDLSNNSGVVFGIDKDGNALSEAVFNASNSLSWNDTTDIVTGNTFTVSMWINQTIASALQYLFAKHTNADTKGFSIYINSTNIYIQFPNTSPVTILTAGYPTVNERKHLVYVKDAGMHYLFINGVLMITPTVNTSSIIPDASLHTVYIGNSNIGTGFKGSIDEVRYYSRAITHNCTVINQVASGEVGELYQMGVNYASVLPTNVVTNKILDLKVNQFACTQITGISQTNSNTTVTLSGTENSISGQYAGCVIEITSAGAFLGKQRIITAYDGATKIATVGAWAGGGTPATGATYKIYHFGTKDSQSGLPVFSSTTNVYNRYVSTSQAGSTTNILVTTSSLKYKGLVALYEDNEIIYARKIKDNLVSTPSTSFETKDLYESSVPSSINTSGDITFSTGKPIVILGIRCDGIAYLGEDYYGNLNKVQMFSNTQTVASKIYDSVGIFSNTNFTMTFFTYGLNLPDVYINYESGKGVYISYTTGIYVCDKLLPYAHRTWSATKWYFNALTVCGGIVNWYTVEVGQSFYADIKGTSASVESMIYSASNKFFNMSVTPGGSAQVATIKYWDRALTVPELKIMYDRGMTPVEAPTELIASSGLSNIELNWKISEDATGCKIYRALTDEDNAYEFIASVVV